MVHGQMHHNQPTGALADGHRSVHAQLVAEPGQVLSEVGQSIRVDERVAMAVPPEIDSHHAVLATEVVALRLIFLRQPGVTSW